MLVDQGHIRDTLDRFRTAGSDWGSIKATMLSFPVQRIHFSSSSRKVSGLTPTEVFCPSHSQKPY
jgi:hypothetical protein